ncbi:probable ATP-dependent DNA helicase HFM1 isoform X5 [Hydra vulgaris]|uniref:Probable ATP-dependent DNA helicase HFM1 isoform X5 n=1 Tax=Hydra vulgaris TaxID=6087 RepID=A0ABM4DF15_HYDVU
MDSPKPFLISSADGSVTKLKSVREIPEEYRRVFPFLYFNALQSKLFDKVMYSDNPIVVCSPTGSGKTVLFELCIIRFLLKSGASHSLYKVVYMAPIKALCNERYQDWNEKFGMFGLRCTELTGDTDLDDLQELQYSNIIFTTPEKWDNLTRKWKDYKSLFQSVRLFMIDEVHLLNDNARGATMEAVVSRMKTVQVAINNEKSKTDNKDMRFIAVSATIPNVDDIAAWLDTGFLPAFGVSLGNEYRPVQLKKVVLGYEPEKKSDFLFDLTLSYKLSGVIRTYSDNKPTLIFCSTRKSVVQAAGILVKDQRNFIDSRQRQRLFSYANTIHDSKLQDCVKHGCGYHHAGLNMNDRKRIEEIFSTGDLPVLVCTSTLAMGVNLPAHLVIIKGTMHYEMSSTVEYSEAQILQMMGRAGRPQFDTSATAVVMTKNQNKKRYEDLVSGNQNIESSLHHHLTEHLNAEIVLGTIENADVAQDWLKSTFLYRRMQENPKYYGAPEGLDKDAIGKRLQETGKLLARYCVDLKTMKLFSTVNGKEDMADMVSLLSNAEEFKEITIRQNEKKILNMLNKDKDQVTIRFPLSSKISSTAMKINCLLQAALGCLSVIEFSLLQDTAKIFQIGQRISRFMMEYFLLQNNFQAALNSVLLCKCIRAKLWENSPYVSRQLEKIGATLSAALVNAGLTSFQKMEETNPREIELVLNRHPPFGSQVKELISSLPKVDLKVEQEGIFSSTQANILVKIMLLNNKDVQHHQHLLIIGDADNKIVFKQKLFLHNFHGHAWSKKITVIRSFVNAAISVNLINLHYVGLDVQTSFTPVYSVDLNKNFYEENSYIADSTFKKMKPYVDCNHKCVNKMNCGHRCCKPVLQRISESNKKSSKGEPSSLQKLPPKRSKATCKQELQNFNLVTSKNVINGLKAFSYKPKRSGYIKNDNDQNENQVCKRQKLSDGGILSQVNTFQSLRAQNSFYDDFSVSNLFDDITTDQKLTDVEETIDQFGRFEEDFYKDTMVKVDQSQMVPVLNKFDNDKDYFSSMNLVTRAFFLNHSTTSVKANLLPNRMNNSNCSLTSKTLIPEPTTSHSDAKMLKIPNKKAKLSKLCYNITNTCNNSHINPSFIFDSKYSRNIEDHSEYLNSLSSMSHETNFSFQKKISLAETKHLNDCKLSNIPTKNPIPHCGYIKTSNLMHVDGDCEDNKKILEKTRANSFNVIHENSQQTDSQYEVKNPLILDNNKKKILESLNTIHNAQLENKDFSSGFEKIETPTVNKLQKTDINVFDETEFKISDENRGSKQLVSKSISNDCSYPQLSKSLSSTDYSHAKRKLYFSKKEKESITENWQSSIFKINNQVQFGNMVQKLQDNPDDNFDFIDM